MLLSAVGFIILMIYCPQNYYAAKEQHLHIAGMFVDILINNSWDPILTIISLLQDLEQVI
jgi:hypothetical protein